MCIRDRYVNYAIRTTGSGDSTKNDPLTTNEAGKELTFIDNNDDGVVDYAQMCIRDRCKSSDRR